MPYKTKYKILIFDSVNTAHAVTESGMNEQINALAEEGWRVEQIATSPGYGESGLAHNSDFAPSVSVTVLMSKPDPVRD